jgi:hypothetical protein
MKYFKKMVEDQGIVEDFDLSSIYERAHELISKMSSNQIEIVKKHHPEVILISEKYGEVENLRTNFDH